MLFSVILLLVSASNSLPTSPSHATLIEAKLALDQDTGFLILALLLGFLTTILGGFLAARIAKELPFYYGLAARSIAPMYCHAWIVIFLNLRSWPCLVLAARLFGVLAPHTCKAAWSLR
jgi:hypothetical protein